MRLFLVAFVAVIGLVLVDSGVVSEKVDYENDPAVSNFRAYLRIPSVHPNVNYDECIAFLRAQASQLGLPHQVVEVLPLKPVLVMTWQGSEPSLPAVLLNSHMDVVPVFPESWVHPPFEAFMDENGTIFGRGAQDMKSVGIQYIESVRRLKAAGVTLKRTVHLSFVPDEEIGGLTGMAEFLKTEEFKKLNVGFSLDEGISTESQEFIVFASERAIWHIDIICTGKSGHGSLLHENTAGEKIRYIIDKFMDLREQNKRQLKSDPKATVGDVTTINLTKLRGGIQENVVPESLTATFDIRLALSVNHQEFEDMIKRWCAEAGEGVTYKFIQKQPYVVPTKLDSSNPYWLAFKAAADQLKLSVVQRVFPGGTDSRYLRELGIPAIGFSPMNGTELKLHEHNEHLSAATFLRGIRIYEALVPALANV